MGKLVNLGVIARRFFSVPVISLVWVLPAQAQHSNPNTQYMHWINAQQNAAAYEAYKEERRQRREELLNTPSAPIDMNAIRPREDDGSDSWGVILLDAKSDGWLTTSEESSPDAGMAVLIDRCKGVCWPLVTFANTCMAPAASSAGATFWGSGDTPELAAKMAVGKCESANQGKCVGQPEQHLCSGYKYRVHPADQKFTAGVASASAKVEYFPGAEEFLAAVPAQRGTVSSLGGGDTKGQKEVRSRLARGWSVVAVQQGGKAMEIATGLTPELAGADALRRCGGVCKPLVTFGGGSCMSLVTSPAPGGANYFAGQQPFQKLTAQQIRQVTRDTADEVKQAGLEARASSGPQRTAGGGFRFRMPDDAQRAAEEGALFNALQRTASRIAADASGEAAMMGCIEAGHSICLPLVTQCM